MDQYVIKVITRAIGVPMFRQKIYTLNMPPYNKKLNYVIGPSAITFYFELAKVNDLSKALKLNDAITMSVSRAMNLSHGKTLKVRLSAQGGYLTIGVARLDRWLPCWQDVKDKISNNLFVGFDEFNEPVYLDLFSETSPGLFAVGSSGSGKTNLIRLLLNQLREKGIEYYLIDLKGGKDWRYDLAHFAKDSAFDEEKAEDITSRIFNIMQTRNTTNAKHEPLVFVFDEVTEASPSLQETLGRLAKLCRSANIRLIFGAQRIGEDLNNEIKGNLKRRVVGFVSGSDAFNATGIKASGAQHLEMKGDMLICHSHGLKRVQVPRANLEDLALIVPTPTPKQPIIDVKPKAKPASKKILKDDRNYLLSVLPIEKRTDFFKWIEPMIKAVNQSLLEKKAKEIDPRIAFFSAHAALKTRKPATIKAIEGKLKALGITGTRKDRVRLIRYLGGLVIADERSIKEVEQLFV